MANGGNTFKIFCLLNLGNYEIFEIKSPSRFSQWNFFIVVASSIQFVWLESGSLEKYFDEDLLF